MVESKKKKKCKKGYSCGFTCISEFKACRVELRGAVGQFLDKKVKTIDNTPSSKDLDPLGLEIAIDDTYGMSKSKKAKLEKHLKKEGLIEKSQVRKTLNAIDDFTTTSFARMREADRDGTEDERVKAIYDNFLYNEKFPTYNGEVYRGMSFSDDKAGVYNLSPGDTLTMDSLSSSSASKAVANSFGLPNEDAPYGVMLVVKNNKSGKSVMPFSRVRGEEEVLLPRGINYKVAKVSMDPEVKEFKGMKVIELEEV